MFDPLLLEAMPFTASFTPVAARDLYGGRTYGTGIPFPCYWQEDDDDRETPDGQERVGSGKIWLPTAMAWTPVPFAPPVVSTSLGLILPNGERASIRKVTTWRDQDGIYGYEVAYG